MSYIVMRLNNNPNGRGFTVSANEFVKKDEVGQLHFKSVEKSEHGTKKSAEKAYGEMKAKYSDRLKPATKFV